MDEQQSGPAARSRRPSGRDAKIAARTARSHAFVPYITRNIPYYEVLTAGGLELLENNADTILEEIGIDFRDDAESLDRKSTRLNSSHRCISYAVFCLKKKKKKKKNNK